MTPSPEAALTDEVLSAAIDAISEWHAGDTRIVRCASSFAEMRQVLLAALAASAEPPVETCDRATISSPVPAAAQRAAYKRPTRGKRAETRTR